MAIKLKIFQIAVIWIYSTQALARYTDYQYDDGTGGFYFFLFILLFAAFLYIKDAFKKSYKEGIRALVITGGICIGAYIFPVIAYALIAITALLVMWFVIRDSF